MNFINRARGGTTKFLRVHLFVKRNCTDQLMRRFRKCCGIRFCGQKIESAINLECISANNFRARFECDSSRQLGFPSRGWTDDEEGVVHNDEIRNSASVAAQPFVIRALSFIRHWLFELYHFCPDTKIGRRAQIAPHLPIEITDLG
jgi:hypothetical protein